MRERDVENYLVKQVRKIGGEVRKVKWIGRRGAPDRLVMTPAFSFFLELKRPSKKPTAQQEREMDRLRSYGFKVSWVNSKEQVDQLLKGMSLL